MAKKSDKERAYNRRYQANCRGIVCNTVRGTLEDSILLNQWKVEHQSTTWLQLLYRGAGIKRPEKIKATKTTQGGK